MARVLIVEDNRNLAHGLRTNLEFEGHRAEIASDGDAGLRRARSGEHDIVVLDLMLPELDGYRILETLRREGHTVPVLVLTARGDEADKVRGLETGADDYVTKPFALRELLARVAALLRRSAGRAPANPPPQRQSASAMWSSTLRSGRSAAAGLRSPSGPRSTICSMLWPAGKDVWPNGPSCSARSGDTTRAS